MEQLEALKETGAYYGRPEGNLYGLSKGQRLDLVYAIAEVLSYDGSRYPQDDIREVAGCWVDSHSYADTRRDWVDAGYPEPAEFDWEPDDLHGKTIHELMKLGVALAFLDWSEKLFAGCDTRPEALALANAYLFAHGWNTLGIDGRISTHGTTHNQTEERCEECPTHCHA